MTMLKLAIPFAVSLFLASTAAVLAQDMGYEKAMMDAHKKMMDHMAMKPSGDPDKDFVMMMIPHHQGAVDMAEIELKYGKDPELKKMAQEIIDAQNREIEAFKKWQGAHQ